MKLLKHYKNGNYFVSIFEDGTKIRQTNEDEFIPIFPENIDMKISDRCDMGCEMCFTEDAKILMGDFSYKYIKDIKIGDIVIGFEEKASNRGAKRKFFKTKVLKTFQHVESELIKITTDTGNSIMSTPNHPFLSQGTGKNHAKVFNKIESIPVGGFLFETGFPNIDIDYNSDNYKLGYVVGSWIGDGAIWKGVDKKGYEAYSCRFVTKDEEINERVFDFTTHFNSDFYYLDFEMMGNGIKKSVRSNKKSSYEFLTSIINSNLDINTNIEYCCGLLAGIFDSEGHIDKQRGTIRIANTNVRYIKEVERCLNLLNIENTTEFYKQNTSNYSKGYLPVYNVRVKGRYGWNKFLWYTRPVCIRKSFECNVSNNIQHWKSYIIKKETIDDKCYVYNFETECHTYIANNFMVHNCHENSTKEGKIAHFNHRFLDTLKAGQEIAIGGGNIFENNKLEPFLIRMKNQGVFCNITIHQIHAEQNIELISKWINKELVRGVGISYNGDYEQVDRIFNKLEQLNSTTSNIILHTINGIHNFIDLMKLNDKKNKKVLILGYKSVRRGFEFIQENNDKITQNQQSMYNNLEALSKTFKVLSFDNLAIEQLEVKRIIPEDKWGEFFMGNDSEFTMYLDLCKEDFAVNSCEIEHRHKLLDSIEDMFKMVKEDGVKYGYNKKQEEVI